MGRWTVDATSEPGILHVKLEGNLSDAEIGAFVSAHNAGVDSFGRAPYRVFCDLRAMGPLSPDGARVMERAKQYSASRSNFQGSAVLIASQVIAMQHRRTSSTGGVIDTELISDNEAACRAHLKAVRRHPVATPA